MYFFSYFHICSNNFQEKTKQTFSFSFSFSLFLQCSYFVTRLYDVKNNLSVHTTKYKYKLNTLKKNFVVILFSSFFILNRNSYSYRYNLIRMDLYIRMRFPTFDGYLVEVNLLFLLVQLNNRF